MMENKEYIEKLKDPRWQQKRLRIMERDGWKCKCCNNSQLTLHVHHRAYENGKEPWEYDDDYLVTLCADCHDIETQRIQDSIYSLSKSIRKTLFSEDIAILDNGFLNASLAISSFDIAIAFNQILGEKRLQIIIDKIYGLFCNKDKSKYEKAIKEILEILDNG